MAASAKKIIAVTGATGAQGGGVVDALLSSGKYEVRAITRDPSSEKGKALTKKGAKVCTPPPPPLPPHPPTHHPPTTTPP
jgi:nucleoside-diphosphate-sugar epimerase